MLTPLRKHVGLGESPPCSPKAVSMATLVEPQGFRMQRIDFAWNTFVL